MAELLDFAWALQPGAFGIGQSRVQAFLLKRLGSSARSRYLEAHEALRCKLEAASVPWSRMNEEDRDWWLAEHILDEYEAGGQRSSCLFLLSALAKVNPRAQYRTSWKTPDVWTTEEPVRQAPAAPPGLLFAMFTYLSRSISGHTSTQATRSSSCLGRQSVVLNRRSCCCIPLLSRGCSAS